MTNPATPTALHDCHVSLGATLTDFAGFSMPLRYSSEVAEHHAVREKAGIFDLSHMGQIEVGGPQADQALDYSLVGRPSKMRVGEARYSMIVDTSGGILDDLVVYRLAPERFLIVANASNQILVARELHARSTDYQARVDDVSEAWALIAVQGPISEAIVSAVAGCDLSRLSYYAIVGSTVESCVVWIARTGYTGEDGFEIYCQAQDAAMVWNRLHAVGVPRGMLPAGLAARDSLRLEAGMALYGQELGVDVDPFQVDLGRLVNFEKPDGFVGDKALLAAAAAPPRRKLIGLTSLRRRAPRTGQSVIDPRTGDGIGVVTSGVPSPTLGHAIGMALVKDLDINIGDQLIVDIRGREETFWVAPRPFYTRPSRSSTISTNPQDLDD